MSVVTGDDHPKRFLLDRERDQLPICNQTSGARNLFTDEVIRRTERYMAEEAIPRKRYMVNPWVALFLFAAGLTGLVKLFISML
jgi:hypothetical protein